MVENTESELMSSVDEVVLYIISHEISKWLVSTPERPIYSRGSILFCFDPPLFFFTAVLIKN